MAASRKLQGEIDRCLKKVTEGVDTFEETWKKVHNATNSNQKEKYEADLKKEIKKLQRLRDQIKSWIASGEIKDKSALLETRKLIETQMERFKVVERETKTKAYSKEGLGAAQKLDPAQKERDEMREWLGASIETLNLQVDQFECEIESLIAGKKKKLDKDKQDRVDELRGKLEKHRYHIRKLETLLRMLHNMSVDVAKLREIKDDVEYYVDSWEEPDFKENEFIYDDIIGLEEVELSQTLAGSVDSNDTGGRPTPTSTVSDESSEHPMAALMGISGTSTHAHGHIHASSSSSAPPLSHHSTHSPSSASSSATDQQQLYQQHKVVKPTAVRAVAATGAVSTSASIGRPVGSSTPTKQSQSPAGAHVHAHSPATNNSAAAGTLLNNSTSNTPHKGENGVDLQLRTDSPTSSASSSSMAAANTTSSAAASSSRDSPSPQSAASLLPSNTTHHHHPPGHHHHHVSTTAPHSHGHHHQQQMVHMNGPTTASKMTTDGMSSLKHMAQEAVNKATLNITNNNNSTSSTSSTNNSHLLHNQLTNSASSGVSAGGTNSGSSSGSHQHHHQQQPQQHHHQNMQHHHHSQQEMNDDSGALNQCSIVIPPLLGVSPLGTVPLNKDQHIRLQLLESAHYRMPHPMDTERLRPFLHRTPFITPSYYPQHPLQAGDSPDYFQRLSTETLFFIFYYLEGTKAQYLAAKALKKQSWRFHTKYMMWFQRHEEPKVINEDYEQGTYIYFDYEKWSQKKKEGFTFEYKYLEDRELI